MKIISTLQPTKKSTIAESGSTCTPTFEKESPVGNQSTALAKMCLPNSGVLSAAQKTAIHPSHESAAAPTAMLWLSALLRLVNKIIKKKANNGGRGINQMIVSGD